MKKSLLLSLLLIMSASSMAIAFEIDREPDALPKMEQVNGRIEAAHLDDQTANWDQLDRDILYRRARSLDMANLKKFYPQIAPAKLARLKRLTKSHIGLTK